MATKITRRNLLRIGGCAGAGLVVAGVGGVGLYEAGTLDRLFGISHTPELDNENAWAYADNVLTVDLAQVTDLAEINSGVQLDHDTLPEPLLIVHGDDDEFYVFVNKCPHADRKIDVIDGQVRCTSMGKSTFDYAGTRLSGTADSPLPTYEVARDGDTLTIRLLSA